MKVSSGVSPAADDMPYDIPYIDCASSLVLFRNY